MPKVPGASADPAGATAPRINNSLNSPLPADHSRPRESAPFALRRRRARSPDSTRSSRRQGTELTRPLVLLALAAAFALVAAGASSARLAADHTAKSDTPCWKILTNDAFDGKVDGLYPIAVYGEAIRHLPTDVQSYSSIADVINRARQAALLQRGKGVTADPESCGYALGDSGGATGGAAAAGGGGGAKGPIPGVIDSVGSDKADSFPVALIAIAAVAGLLVVGGGLGFTVRRQQQRRSELDAASGSSGPGIDPVAPRELNP